MFIRLRKKFGDRQDLREGFLQLEAEPFFNWVGYHEREERGMFGIIQQTRVRTRVLHLRYRYETKVESPPRWVCFRRGLIWNSEITALPCQDQAVWSLIDITQTISQSPIGCMVAQKGYTTKGASPAAWPACVCTKY